MDESSRPHFGPDGLVRVPPAPASSALTTEAGFDHHLTKPTDPGALAELLTRFAAGAG